MRTKTLKAYGIGSLFRRIQHLKRDDKVPFGVAAGFLLILSSFLHKVEQDLDLL